MAEIMHGLHIGNATSTTASPLRLVLDMVQYNYITITIATSFIVMNSNHEWLLWSAPQEQYPGAGRLLGTMWPELIKSHVFDHFRP